MGLFNTNAELCKAAVDVLKYKINCEIGYKIVEVNRNLTYHEIEEIILKELDLFKEQL